MAKKKKFKLETKNEIKVFILFLLNNINYPIDHNAVIGMLSENTDEIRFDYEECLRELADIGHLYFEENEGEKYYMISNTGRRIANELYDTIDKDFRERSIKYTAKYTSLSKNGSTIEAVVTETEGKRYTVTLRATDTVGEVLSASLTVNSREEAEKIKRRFESQPDAVYRGILFSATGILEFLS